MLKQVVSGAMAGAAGLMAYAVRHPRSQLLAPSIHKGPADRRSLALTFDDGPSESTEPVLEILARHGVKGTFFQCGANVLRLPGVAKEVLHDGHEVGNHSQNHVPLFLSSPAQIRREFSDAQASITATLGCVPRLMRPPFGVRWFGFRETQRDLNLLSVMWTVIGLDWKLRSQAISRRLLRGASSGAIFCLHDGLGLQSRPELSQTLRALRETIPALQDRGFHFETISQILCPMN